MDVFETYSRLHDYSAAATTSLFDMSALPLADEDSVLVSGDGRPFLYSAAQDKLHLIESFKNGDTEKMSDRIQHDMPKIFAVDFDDRLIERIERTIKLIEDEGAKRCTFTNDIIIQGNQFIEDERYTPYDGYTIDSLDAEMAVEQGFAEFLLTTSYEDEGLDVFITIRSSKKLMAEDLHYYQADALHQSGDLNTLAWVASHDVATRALDKLEANGASTEALAAALVARITTLGDEADLSIKLAGRLPGVAEEMLALSSVALLPDDLVSALQKITITDPVNDRLSNRKVRI